MEPLKWAFHGNILSKMTRNLTYLLLATRHSVCQWWLTWKPKRLAQLKQNKGRSKNKVKKSYFSLHQLKQATRNKKVAHSNGNPKIKSPQNHQRDKSTQRAPQWTLQQQWFCLSSWNQIFSTAKRFNYNLTQVWLSKDHLNEFKFE